MRALKFVYAAALAVGGVLAAPPTGQAAFLLQLQSGAQTTTIDLGALSTGGPGSGSGYTYTFFFKEFADGTTTATFTNLEFGGYTISSSTNITNTPGGPGGGNLSLNGLTVSRNAGSADALTIRLTATGYTRPGVQDSLDSNFAARLNTLAQTVPVVDFRSSYAAGSNPFGGDVSNLTTTEETNFGPVSPRTPFEASAQADLSGGTSSYSLTNVVTITGLGFGVSNRLDQGGVSTLVTPLSVPAPTGLMLMAGAVPFLALLRRRARPADTPAETPHAG